MHSEAWLEIDQPAMKQMLGREIDVQTMEDHPEKNERNKLIDRQANILKIALRKVKEMSKERQNDGSTEDLNDEVMLQY